MMGSMVKEFVNHFGTNEGTKLLWVMTGFEGKEPSKLIAINDNLFF